MRDAGLVDCTMASRAAASSNRQPRAGDDWLSAKRPSSTPAVTCYFVLPDSICIKGACHGTFWGSVSFSLADFRLVQKIKTLIGGIRFGRLDCILRIQTLDFKFIQSSVSFLLFSFSIFNLLFLLIFCQFNASV